MFRLRAIYAIKAGSGMSVDVFERFILELQITDTFEQQPMLHDIRVVTGMVLM